MNIPIVLTPHEDELLISWIYRLMKVNDIPRITDFEQHVVGCRVFGDGYFNVTRFADSLGIPEMSAGRMLVRHTAFPEYCAQARASERETVLGIMTGRRKRTVPPKSIRYCPECMREICDSYGNPVLFRFHQNVSVCPVHGVPLMMCTLYRGDRRVKDSYWALDRRSAHRREWTWSKQAFGRDFQYARFVRDLMHSELPLTRELLEKTVLFRLAENGVDCTDINSVQEYLQDVTEYEAGFCLQEAGSITGGLNLLTGRDLLYTAFTVFGTAAHLEADFRRAFPPGMEKAPAFPDCECRDCGCGVFEIHSEDGSVTLARGDGPQGGKDEQTYIG